MLGLASVALLLLSLVFHWPGTVAVSLYAVDAHDGGPPKIGQQDPLPTPIPDPTPTPTSYVYDDFKSGTYQLFDGQTSPNGLWQDVYNGYGSSGVRSDGSDLVYYEYPQTSTSADVTHSDLTISTQSFHNYKLSLDMKTVEQLRQNSAPNNWENAWVMFNYLDNYHHYYFTLKDTGWELGKKDNNLQQDAQIFLATGTSPSVTHGQWQHVDITMVNNVITVYVNGQLVTQTTDISQSDTFANGGHIGLYNEDSSVEFNNVSVTPQ